MKRGEIITVAMQGDYGKPRPAVVIQSDWLDDTDSVLVCPISTTRRDSPLYRLDVSAGRETGLREPSQIMVEKITAVRREKCGPPMGRLDAASLVSLSRTMALMIGIAD